MSNHKQLVEDALRAFNQAERAEFMAATGTRWLGLDGPVYILGEVRAKTIFDDSRGRHWVDAALAIESYSGTGCPPSWPLEAFRDVAVDLPEADDLWVFTDTRGRWNAVMAPVAELARVWELPPPTILPGNNWARTWLDLPERTDNEELAWVANGGNPDDTRRIRELM